MARGTRQTAVGPEAVIGVQIDLRAEGLSFVATPSNGDDPLETAGETAPQFLQRREVQLALNTAFFTPCCSYFGTEPKDLVGFAVSQGEKVSDWHSTRPVAFAITRDHQVSFLRSQPPAVGDLWIACAGMELLREGKPVTDPNDNRHPRTAIGLSRDGKTLYFLLVDGRQPKHSIGTSLHDTARWLLALGAHEGINVDGGGSTILVVDSPRLGGQKILNRPSAGLPRVNGAHLGVIALPLP